MEKEEIRKALSKKEEVAYKYQKRYEELWLLMIAEGAIYSNLEKLVNDLFPLESNAFNRIYLYSVENHESIRLK